MHLVKVDRIVDEREMHWSAEVRVTRPEEAGPALSIICGSSTR
jgi:hypothetical protein